RRQLHAAALAAVLAFLPLAVILFAENHFVATPERPASDGQIRLVHWNVEGALSPETQEVLRSQQADLYVLSEIPDASAVEEFRAMRGLDYQAQVFGNLAVVAAGTIRADGWLINRPRTKAKSLTWEHNGSELHLLVVDLPSEIHIHRDPL